MYFGQGCPLSFIAWEDRCLEPLLVRSLVLHFDCQADIQHVQDPSSCHCETCCPDTRQRLTSPANSESPSVFPSSAPSASPSRRATSPRSSSNNATAPSVEAPSYTPLAQSLADTQATLQRASSVIESAYQRLALLRESIRRNIEGMPHDLSEVAPNTGATTAMGPNHSAIVLSEQSSSLHAEPRPNSPNAIAESYERTRNSSSPHRPPWVAWNGFTINPYDQRASGSQPLDLRASRRNGSTNPPTRRSLVEHYFAYRRDPNPNDPSTSLGRSVEGRSSGGQGSPSRTGSVEDSMSRIRDVTTDIESAITRLNRQRAELSQASGGFRRTQGFADPNQEQQPEPRGSFEPPLTTTTPRLENNSSNGNSGFPETQRSAWRTVNQMQESQPQRPIATRTWTRRGGSNFLQPPTTQSFPANPPTATSSRPERITRTRTHPRAPPIAFSDFDFSDDSEEEIESFDYWLDRVRRESIDVDRLRAIAVALPQSSTLQATLRERLDLLRRSFNGATSVDSLGQRTTLPGMSDSLTNGRRRRRGWGKYILRRFEVVR